MPMHTYGVKPFMPTPMPAVGPMCQCLPFSRSMIVMVSVCLYTSIESSLASYPLIHAV